MVMERKKRDCGLLTVNLLRVKYLMYVPYLFLTRQTLGEDCASEKITLGTLRAKCRGTPPSVKYLLYSESNSVKAPSFTLPTHVHGNHRCPILHQSEYHSHFTSKLNPNNSDCAKIPITFPRNGHTYGKALAMVSHRDSELGEAAPCSCRYLYLILDCFLYASSDEGLF